MLDRIEPVLSFINLKSQVVEADILTLPRVDRGQAAPVDILGQLEQDKIVMQLVASHKANRTRKIGRSHPARDLQPQNLSIEFN
jgi:hypothetical protein